MLLLRILVLVMLADRLGSVALQIGFVVAVATVSLLFDLVHGGRAKS